MKILYGVQGTGNGHLTRARVMAKAFKEKGIEVDWVFSGREKSGFFDMEIFGDYQVYRGMTFVTEHGKINFIKTAMQTNIGQFFDLQRFRTSLRMGCTQSRKKNHRRVSPKCVFLQNPEKRQQLCHQLVYA
jgi:uncharacterized protein (TIGR00661 family)